MNVARTCDCRETILLIDSDVNQLTPLQYTLEHLYEISVHIAKDSAEGLMFYKGSVTKKCCQTRYKLILIADSMPDKDGYQTAMEIIEMQEEYKKRNYSIDAVPIVAMTDKNLTESVIEACTYAGMAMALRKPLNSASIKKLILELYK